MVDIFGGSDWSGSGSSSKEVFSDINLIPDANPPPKYSTTRAQPRDHNDLNNIINGDFSQHNHIEKTPDQSLKNNVLVDDFYYDYNFIKFHEELSYDFDLGNNGKDLGDDQGHDPPQEPRPSHGMEDNVHRDTTIDPTTPSAMSTLSKTSPYTLEAEEPRDLSPNTVEGSSNLSTKKPAEIISENKDDFLSEDYFLPVSTTLSPPFSQKWPQIVSTVPSLRFTTNESPGDIKWEQRGGETEDNKDTSEEEEEEEGHIEDIDVTVEYPVTTPAGQTDKDVSRPMLVGGEETEDVVELDYNYHEESTTGPRDPGSQRERDSPEPPLGSPSQETVFQFDTNEDSFVTTISVQLDESTSKIPLPTTTPSFESSKTSPTALLPDDLDFDQQDFDTERNTDSEDDSRVTGHYLIVTSHPVSQESPTPPVPSQPISGNQEDSDYTSSTTGTDSLPPTDQGRATQPSPLLIVTDTQHATMEPQIYTQSTLTESTIPRGTNANPHDPSPYNGSDFDYNEIVIPPMLRSRGTIHPPHSHQPLTFTAVSPQYSTLPTTPTTQSLGSAVPTLPTHPPTLQSIPVPTPVQVPASTRVTTAAYWVTGNWSAVSSTSASTHSNGVHLLWGRRNRA